MSELFSSLKISGAGLSINRRKMNVTAENIANAETTRTQNGGPYRKKSVAITGTDRRADFNSILRRHTVSLARTDNEHIQTNRKYERNSMELILPQAHERVAPKNDVKIVYDPSHPDANQDGWVEMPNINIVVEMVNMMTAARAYEANATTLEATKNIYAAAMDI